MRAGVLRIRTPEGVVFSLPLAGVLSRCLALAIDLAAIGAVTDMAARTLGALRVLNPDLSAGVVVLVSFVISTGYAMVLEWFWRGQTVGKRVMRLRVMDRGGLRLEPSQIVVRNLLRVLDMLPGLYLVGGVTALVTRYSQRLGDLAASTVVVRTVQGVIADVDQLMAGKYNSLAEYPHLAARLRQRVSPGAADIALRAILRRDSLADEARVELFGELAGYFRGLADFPESASEGLTDEQYVRNAVGVLFQRHKGGR